MLSRKSGELSILTINDFLNSVQNEFPFLVGLVPPGLLYRAGDRWGSASLECQKWLSLGAGRGKTERWERLAEGRWWVKHLVTFIQQGRASWANCPVWPGASLSLLLCEFSLKARWWKSFCFVKKHQQTIFWTIFSLCHCYATL